MLDRTRHACIVTLGVFIQTSVPVAATITAFIAILNLAIAFTGNTFVAIACAVLAAVISMLVALQYVAPAMLGCFEHLLGGKFDRGRCPICDDGSLVDHMTFGGPNWIECDKCSAYFTGAGNQLRHIDAPSELL